MADALNLETVALRPGRHATREEGVNLLEAAAWYAGEPHSQEPDCVSHVLGHFGLGLTRALPEVKRQRLVRFIPRLPGTGPDGRDETRAYLALDWLVRVYTPAWLELGGGSPDLPWGTATADLVPYAAEIRNLPPVNGSSTDAYAGWIVRAARDEAIGLTSWIDGFLSGRDAFDPVEQVAEDATLRACFGAAASSASHVGEHRWNIAWGALREPALHPNPQPTLADTPDPDYAPGYLAATVVAYDAAQAAATGASVGAEAEAGREAMRVAAHERLAPTVDRLQDSAVALFATMIDPSAGGR